MKGKKRRKNQLDVFVKINEQIRYPEARVLDSEGNNLGVMLVKDALREAKKLNLDLIEISWKSKPPLIKIADYGKYKYDLKKKASDIKSKTKTVETKVIQVKTATGDGDLIQKAKKISSWLKEGNRVKLDLFLFGRGKYMKIDFHKERLERVLKFVTEDYNIVDGPKKSPKGLTAILEKSTKKKVIISPEKKSNTAKPKTVNKKQEEKK